MAHDLRLLTLKPVLYIANVQEGAGPGGSRAGLREMEEALAAAGLAGSVIPVSAALEEELTELEPEERKLFLEELGVAEPGLQRVIRAPNCDRAELCVHTNSTAGVARSRLGTASASRSRRSVMYRRRRSPSDTRRSMRPAVSRTCR